MVDRTRSHLDAELDSMRKTQLALTDRLRRILIAMALSEEVMADLHRHLDRLDNRPNGHRQAAAAAAAAANRYRQFLEHASPH
jgi:hypothetical protein